MEELYYHVHVQCCIRNLLGGATDSLTLLALTLDSPLPKALLPGTVGPFILELPCEDGLEELGGASDAPWVGVEVGLVGVAGLTATSESNDWEWRTVVVW